ncbi:hypothetical protein Tco_1147967 [Tanacetum coccineum]
MSFGLKDARAKYQRLVDKALEKHIGMSLESNGKNHTGTIACNKDIKKVFPCTSDGGHHGPANQANSIKAKKLRKNGKWTVEMGEHDISCRLRTSIRGQILADFIVEKSKEDLPITSIVMEEVSRPWTLFTDGSSCVKGSKATLILTSPEGVYLCLKV